MKIILGHSNIDLDCLGSMALARYLYPDHQLVRSRLIHPVARNLYNLYERHLNCITPHELREETIEHMVIVDTRSQNRVKEYFNNINNNGFEIDIWDHHPADTRDISSEKLFEGNYGSNTTLIGLKLIQNNIEIESEDATIALTGIYADTGNFTHENVTPEDFTVASFLLDNGASLSLVKSFLKSLKEKHQITLFHEILNRLTYKNINGHEIIMSYLELEEQEAGLSAVIEKIFEIETPDALFSLFHFTKKGDTLIVSRSQSEEINLSEIMHEFGGGGHSKASSALVKNKSGMMVYAQLEQYLLETLNSAVVVEDIMTKNVSTIRDTMTILEASITLEKMEHTGAPVLAGTGELVGFLTLRDIMKARKVDQMNSPVRAYMSTKLVTASRNMTVRQIEQLLFEKNIGHLPVVEGKGLIGLVTRTDLLNQLKRED